MEKQECPLVDLVVRDHPNADRLERVQALGYECVSQKGKYQTGDRAVYIPEGSILPEPLIELMGLSGMLAGSKKNRVKTVRLRGHISQGLLFPLTEEGRLQTPWGDGSISPEDPQANANYLGIEKYVPDIPQSMAGNLESFTDSPSYKIENLQSHPDVLHPGERIHCTEKIHGTLCCLMSVDGVLRAASKGFLGKAAFQDTPENRERNVYMRTLIQNQEKLEALRESTGTDFWLFGEVFGKGIQDLGYGIQAQGQYQFRAFDLCLRQGTKRIFVSPAELREHCEKAGIDRVPDLGVIEWPDLQGQPVDAGKLLQEELNLDRETLSGEALHVSEGAVLRPEQERSDDRLGRVILKLKNPNYLTRKGGTERN